MKTSRSTMRVRTVAMAMVTLLLAAWGASGSAGAASAAQPPSLGWFRVSPATGTWDQAWFGLSQAPCPKDGTNVVLKITGPGIPNDPQLGYLVGNTAVTALPPTPTGQLYVPISSTLHDWFTKNVGPIKPSGTYTLTLTCRAKFQATKVAGVFTAQMVLDKTGRYRALGEAAKPFNTSPQDDPLGGQGGTLPSTPASQAPSTAPSGAASAPAPQSSAPQAGGSSDGGQAQPAPGQSSAVAAPAEPAQSGGGARTLLLALGVILLAGAGVAVWRSRTAPQGAHAGPSRSSSSADKVDIH